MPLEETIEMSVMEHNGRRKHHQREGERVEQEKQQYPLTRPSSILSLTLDEIQTTVCQPGKAFGSMNMDEFLTNIWTTEECNAVVVTTAVTTVGINNIDPNGIPNPISNCGPSPSLYKQGSLSLPSQLSRKTVDEVWSEIHRQSNPNLQQQFGDPGNATRWSTLGEMTLEDFLIKAGVVTEGGGYDPCPSSFPSTLPHYGLPAEYSMGLDFGEQNHVPVNNGGYHQPQPNFQPQQQVDGSEYGSKTSDVGGDGAGGYSGTGRMVGDGLRHAGSPVSPLSSDGFGGGQVDNSSGLWGVEIGGSATRNGGRKRVLDGPVEKVVERRQRRMIKNRESAARSRARKQAYTVELEAELNNLVEENADLLEEQKKLAEKRRQMILASLSERATRANPREKIKRLERCSTCLW